MYIDGKHVKDLPRDNDGKYVSYAWPGGYPVFYMDKDATILCPNCANKDVDDSMKPFSCDINWEDKDLYCGDCGYRIESAYAE